MVGCFGILPSHGFLNPSWRQSRWFLSTARTFYSQRCRFNGEDGMLWPSLVDHTAPFPCAGCIASPARGRECLATVAQFPWHRLECGYDQ